MTIREALVQAGIGLKQAGIITASLDASLLLAEVLNVSHTTLIASADEPLSQEAHTAFNVLIGRRLKGECTAYILGKKEFWGLEFLVNFSVLVPRPDTETLVEAAITICSERLAADNEAAHNALRVLDLCTGSGAVAISLKHEMPQMDVWATDLSAEALETAKTNAERLLRDGKIHFYQGDLYNALPEKNHKSHNGGCPSLITHCSSLADNSSFPIPHPEFSLIVSNPPYIPSDAIKTLPDEIKKEPLIALDGGKSGLDIIGRIIDGAPEYLTPGGTLAMEADPRQMEKIIVLLEKRRFSNIIKYKDLSGQERVITGKYNHIER